MTFATQITVLRILLVPVFVVLGFRYGATTEAGNPEAWLGWSALGVFIFAAVSDGIDGWIARRFNQRSKLGAFLDPLADKMLMGFGVLVLWLNDWGRPDWHLPMWFAIIVWARDAVIVFGIILIKRKRLNIHYEPHWTGKATTVMQMFALGWVMLGWIDVSPIWPCAIAAALTVWSGITYVEQGIDILRKGGDAKVA